VKHPRAFVTFGSCWARALASSSDPPALVVRREGIDTLTRGAGAEASWSFLDSGRRKRRVAPNALRFGPKLPLRWSADQVSLNIEGVIDGGVELSLAEAQVLIEAWRRHYNHLRPHSSLNYRPPAPETIIPGGRAVAPWASAPAIGAARSPTRTVALESQIH
jgi:transposase InsO family protein